MNFKITVSNGSIKEIIDILKEIDEQKHKAICVDKNLYVCDGAFKNKYLIHFYKGLSKNHKAGQIPYTETTIEFEKIEDKKEEEEKVEEEYMYSREELAKMATIDRRLRYRKNNE